MFIHKLQPKRCAISIINTLIAITEPRHFYCNIFELLADGIAFLAVLLCLIWFRYDANV